MSLTDANTILVVDDEASLRLFLSEELESQGYQVYTAAEGQAALQRLAQTAIDLAIIDLQMPGLNGLELMAAIQQLADVPELIMLTAHASLETSIQAMRRGSTDFLLKPYEIEELLASVERAMARRRKKLKQQIAARLLADSLGLAPGSAQPPAKQSLEIQTPSPSPSTEASPGQPHHFAIHNLILDLESMTAVKDDAPLSLTSTEFRLLAILMKQPGHVFSFEELAEALHGQPVADSFQARDLLKSHIGRLRRKLGTSPAGKNYIINVRGIGYKFMAK